MTTKRKGVRSAQGGGTIRQRADGRWEARYTTGRDTGTGKQVQRSVYGDTQREVLDKLRDATARVSSGTYIEPSRMTVAQWLDVWTSEYMGGIKENTAVTYKTQVEQHIKPALGNVKLGALTVPAVQKLYNDLRRNKGLSPKTIKNVHGVLNRAMNQAVTIRYLGVNPCAGARLPRMEKRTIHPLAGDTVGAFLTAIDGHPLERLFKLTLFTGMRQSEVLGLTWDRVNFERGTLLVDRQLIREKVRGGGFKFASPKNDKSRLLSPAPSVMRILREQQRRQAEAQLQAGTLWGNDWGLVFTNELGRYLTHDYLFDHFKRVARRIGLADNTFHDLRHSYAVAALQSGDDVKTVQENLGHHTAAFTLDVYGHVSERMKQDSAARMEAFIQGFEKP